MGGDHLRHRISFQIDRVSRFSIHQCGLSQGFGNEGDLEALHSPLLISENAGDRQGHPVDRNRTAIDQMGANLHRGLDLNSPIVTFLDHRHRPGAVDMALDQMAAQESVEGRSPFQIDSRTRPKPSKSGHFEGSMDHIEAHEAGFGCNRGQTTAGYAHRGPLLRNIVPVTRIDLQPATNRRGFDPSDLPNGFDESSEHGCSLAGAGLSNPV